MAKEDIAHQGAMEAHVAIIRGIRINQRQNHFQVNTTTAVTSRTSGPCVVVVAKLQCKCIQFKNIYTANLQYT